MHRCRTGTGPHGARGWPLGKRCGVLCGGLHLIDPHDHTRTHLFRLAPQLHAELGTDGAAAARVMRAVSPKFVPREWMLLAAYTAAEAGDLAPLHELATLFADPYAEQPSMDAKYYRRAPAGTYDNGGKPGCAFMSCSS